MYSKDKAETETKELAKLLLCFQFRTLCVDGVCTRGICYSSHLYVREYKNCMCMYMYVVAKGCFFTLYLIFKLHLKILFCGEHISWYVCGGKLAGVGSVLHHMGLGDPS